MQESFLGMKNNTGVYCSRRLPGFAGILLWYFLLVSGQTTGQIRAVTAVGAVRAVVVGISNYQNISRLEFAHKDAESFAEYLRSPAGGNIPADNIRLLTNEKATQAQIGAALSWLISESQPGDQAIIFFSGHGDVETQIANLGFLLAYDANKTTYMAGGAIPVYALQSVITNLSVEKKVQVWLIADACRSGKLAGSETAGAKTTALAMSAQFANELKLLSCGPDEVSLESKDWGGGHSVFSYYLLNGLRGLADANEDQTVTLREIERFLEDSVQRATAARRRQIPLAFGDKNRILTKVDAATLQALKQKKQPAQANPALGKSAQATPVLQDSTVSRLYRQFEVALRSGHLLFPEAGAAYTLYQQIKDHPSVRAYKNPMRNDLAAALQDEAQKAINDYLSADPREMRRRWSLDDSRYRLYPQYLEKAAELLGESHFSYTQVKARAGYFAGLNLRLQGERPANAAMRDSLFREAQARQEKTLSLDSTAAYAYNELGLLARRRAQYPQSIQFFQKALHFSPSWVLPWANLSSSYFYNSAPQQAEECGLKAIYLDSTCALAHYNLGYIYLAQKNTEKAASHFQKTIQFQDSYDDAYYNLGLAYYEGGKLREAEQMWETYLKRYPNDPGTLQSLGDVALSLGKSADYAMPFFLKAIQFDSTYAKAYASLSQVFINQRAYDKSEEILQKLFKIEPNNPEGYFLLAATRSQNANAGIQALEKALQLGFKDLERLKKEPALALLRKQHKYTQLLKQYFPGQ